MTNPRIDLGIAIAHQKLAWRGVIVSHREIAAFCDCTWANIWLIEQRALHKLKRLAHLRNDARIAELMDAVKDLPVADGGDRFGAWAGLVNCARRFAV